MVNQLPIVPNLFEQDDRGARLLASRCLGCGSVYFPRRDSCGNPDCDAERLVDDRLADTGTLYTYTVQQYQPPPLFPLEQWSPYVIGVVEFPHGVRVLGMVRGVEPAQLRIGMTLRISTESLCVTPAAEELVTYAFVPADGAMS